MAGYMNPYTGQTAPAEPTTPPRRPTPSGFAQGLANEVLFGMTSKNIDEFRNQSHLAQLAQLGWGLSGVRPVAMGLGKVGEGIGAGWNWLTEDPRDAAAAAAAAAAPAPPNPNAYSFTGGAAPDFAAQEAAAQAAYQQQLASIGRPTDYENYMLMSTLANLGQNVASTRNAIDSSYGTAQRDVRNIANGLRGQAGADAAAASSGFLNAARAIASNANAAAARTGAASDGRAASAVQQARATGQAQGELASDMTLAAANGMLRNADAWYGLGGESSAQRQQLALQRDVMAAQAQDAINQMVAQRINNDSAVARDDLQTKLASIAAEKAANPGLFDLTGTKLAGLRGALGSKSFTVPVDGVGDVNVQSYLDDLLTLGETFGTNPTNMADVTASFSGAMQNAAANGITPEAMRAAGLPTTVLEYRKFLQKG